MAIFGVGPEYRILRFWPISTKTSNQLDTLDELGNLERLKASKLFS